MVASVAQGYNMQFTPINITSMGLCFLDEKDMLAFVGQVAGECYNSSMDSDKCVQRALNCIKRGHHSPWEHVTLTLKCTVDRGVSHALVRHRHCAFQQSSTIYQKYNELTFIEPSLLSEDHAKQIEQEYKWHIAEGAAPSEARDVLPNCLATNLIITTNIRQWMFMIQRRDGPGDSEKMHIWNAKLRDWFCQNYPRTLGAFDSWYATHPL